MASSDTKISECGIDVSFTHYKLVLLLQLKSKLRLLTILEIIEKLFVGIFRPSQVTLPPHALKLAKPSSKTLNKFIDVKLKKRFSPTE